MRTRSLAIAYTLVVIAVVLIADFDLCRPAFALVKSVPWGDKVCHFTFMGLLTLAVNLALSFRTVRARGMVLLKGTLWVALIVTAEEALQYFIPSRSCDARDLAADYLGIFVFDALARTRLVLDAEQYRRLYSEARRA